MIYAGIVIYNKKCCDSVSIQSLEKSSDFANFEVIIYDNSTEDLGNDEYCKEKSYQYISLKRNMGLSYAYNQIISAITISENDFLLVLDDDTELTNAFVSEIVHRQMKDVNLPVVRSKKDAYIFSPSIIKDKVRSITIKSIDELQGKRITAINSGMVIRTSVFERLKYNENLFLDYVDHDFMERVNDNGYKIQVLNSTITQNIARQNIKNNKSTKMRLKIYGKDYKTFCYGRGKYVFFLFSFLKTVMQYCLKAKTITFLSVYFECI